MLINICTDLYIDRGCLLPYLPTASEKQVVRDEEKDKNMLKQITMACAIYFFRQLYLQKATCCNTNPKHDEDCTMGNTKTSCYQLARRALGLVSEKILADVLRANQVKPIDFTMKQIFDHELYYMIDQVHIEAHFLLSYSWVLNAKNVLQDCIKSQ